MRNILKSFLEKFSPNFLERVLALALVRKVFPKVRDVKTFNTREDLWRDVFNNFQTLKVSVLEFGVFEGDSIKEFAQLNDNQGSQFFGFDSFLGLPEDWTDARKKGAFNVKGAIPQIQDSRVSFVKGWFQNSLPEFLSDFECGDNLIVHYDADLYSATLYVLIQLDALKKPYYAVFDEFTGHETRALYNYIQLLGARVEFIGRVENNTKYPDQVSCKITPLIVYAP